MTLPIYLRLSAAQTGRAVARASRSHRHLSDRPLVIAGYHLAGDPGAPVALKYGTSAGESTVVVVSEPRNRDQRMRALTEFARDLRAYLDGFTVRVSTQQASGPGEVCADAPQLVLPNGATAAWVTDLLGRSLRYLRTDGPYPVDAVLPAVGADLTWFATRRVLPGSSCVLAATDLLRTHWTTGQLPGEDGNLAALLAWVRPEPGQSAASAAAAALAYPPAGPVSDPRWDRDRLQATLSKPDEMHDMCAEALAPAWRHTWAALELVRELPVAAHTAQRWESDRWAWTRHLDRVAAGGAHFYRRLDQLNAFRLLADLERRTLDLERQMALDDPLVMAERVVAGDALTGEVTGRDTNHWLSRPTGRSVLRPLLTIRTTVPFDGPVRTELGLAANPKVRGRVVDVTPQHVTLSIHKGANVSAARAEATLPGIGAAVTFATFAADDRFPDNLPEELPWTHVPRQPIAENDA